MNPPRTRLKYLGSVAVALALAFGLFQTIQIVQGKAQPAGALLTSDDLPPGFVASPAFIGHSPGICGGKSYWRSFDNVAHTRVLHEIWFCESEAQSALALQGLRDNTVMNAPTMGSLDYIMEGQKPAHADALFAICYTYKEDGRKACQTVARYGRLISTVNVDLGSTERLVTRETLLNWTFRRNDRLLFGSSDADWATLLGRVWRTS